MRMDLSTVSVPEHPLHFGPRTSITTPLRSKGLEFRSLLLLHFEIRQQSRPWECGNPEGISKECGKGGKPASWLSMLSILCHFHGLLWKTRLTKSQSPRRPVWEQEPLVRKADYTSKWKVTHWKSVNPSAFFRTDTAYWVEPWLILAQRALVISIVGSLRSAVTAPVFR